MYLVKLSHIFTRSLFLLLLNIITFIQHYVLLYNYILISSVLIHTFPHTHKKYTSQNTLAFITTTHYDILTTQRNIRTFIPQNVILRHIIDIKEKSNESFHTPVISPFFLLTCRLMCLEKQKEKKFLSRGMSLSHRSYIFFLGWPTKYQWSKFSPVDFSFFSKNPTKNILHVHQNARYFIFMLFMEHALHATACTLRTYVCQCVCAF